MDKYQAITPSIVRELLDYDPATGVLTWKWRDLKWFEHTKRPAQFQAIWNTQNAGQRAFKKVSSGPYMWGSILGERFIAHRVCWAHFYGEWPKGVLDHIKAATGNPYDNRIENLRDGDRKQNQRNLRRAKNNTSGVTGVRKNRCGNHQARIKVNGVEEHLGTFKTEAEAIEARKAAEKRHGFHPNHGSD